MTDPEDDINRYYAIQDHKQRIQSLPTKGPMAALFLRLLNEEQTECVKRIRGIVGLDANPLTHTAEIIYLENYRK